MHLIPLLVAALLLGGQTPAPRQGLILVPRAEPESRPSPPPEPLPPQKPRFTLDGIKPFRANHSLLLAPGMIVTIYGENLAPTRWCGYEFSQKGPHPREACGVRVLVGDSPAGLMYAGPKQINLVIPDDAPTLGTAPMRVCVREVCSDPVLARFSTRKIFLKVEGKAYVNMPVWLEVEHPVLQNLRYPCMNWPWGDSEAFLDVRHNGRPLTPLAWPIARGGVVGGLGCYAGGKPSPLPLHLFHRLSQPGTYSVKLTTYTTETTCTSDWTDIVLEPFTAAQREGWLHLIDERMERASPNELIRDILPSLLAYPDTKALARVARLIDHRDHVLKTVARLSLATFDEDAVRRIIPSERLVELRLATRSAVSPPVVQQKVAPEYTEEARRAGLQGSVVLRLQIDASGKLASTGLMRSLGLGLDGKAFEAVKKWRFAPGIKDGKPAAAEITVAVEFRL